MKNIFVDFKFFIVYRVDTVGLLVISNLKTQTGGGDFFHQIGEVLAAGGWGGGGREPPGRRVSGLRLGDLVEGDVVVADRGSRKLYSRSAVQPMAAAVVSTDVADVVRRQLAGLGAWARTVPLQHGGVGDDVELVPA